MRASVLFAPYVRFLMFRFCKNDMKGYMEDKFNGARVLKVASICDSSNIERGVVWKFPGKCLHLVSFRYFFI